MNNSLIGMGSIVVGAIIMLPFIFTGTSSIFEISSKSWLYLFILGVINTSLAYVVFIKLIKRIGPINASFVTYLVPLSSISLGILFLNETLSFVMVLGGFLILLGVFFANTPKKG